MKNRFNIYVLMMTFLFIGVQSCSNEEDFELETQQNTEQSDKVNRNLLDNCYGEIKTLVIDYLGQAGSGFSSKEYFVKDWTGDGIADVMALKNDGRMFFYKGVVSNVGVISSNAPNTTTDPGRNDWKYTLASGTQVGHGWNNFKEFYPADWNGNGITDMMAMHNNNKMYLYLWNGSSFVSGVDVGVPSTGSAGWFDGRKRMVVYFGNDNRADLIEIADFPSGSVGIMKKLSWNGSSFNSLGGITYGYKTTYDYYPFDYNNDGNTDLIIRKPDGTLKYRENTGYTFSSEKHVGHGWNGYQDLYPGRNWSICSTITSLTGRKANGDLYSYRWNPVSDSFYPGKKVGHGWQNYTHLFMGDLTPDIYHRDDILGLASNGKMLAYGTVLQME